jgi:hypothetical protein
VGPLAMKGMNVTRAFSVGTGRGRPGANVYEAHGARGRGERVREIRGGMVLHHPPYIIQLP